MVFLVIKVANLLDVINVKGRVPDLFDEGLHWSVKPHKVFPVLKKRFEFMLLQDVLDVVDKVFKFDLEFELEVEVWQEKGLIGLEVVFYLL